MKNDVSLLIDSYLPLWEQQSSYNPNILRDFLKKHRAEVMDVCLTEYNEEVFVNGIREDGRAEGRAEGHADSIRTLLRKGKTTTEIHDLLDYPMEEIVEVSKKLQ
jgi:predicted transposase YdaD